MSPDSLCPKPTPIKAMSQSQLERILDGHLNKVLKEKKDLLAHNEMLFISGTNILKRGKNKCVLGIRMS